MVDLFSHLNWLKSQGSPRLIIYCLLAPIDAHVGEIGFGSDNNNGFQSKSMSELDAKRELTKKEVLQVETNVQQQWLLL